MKDQRITLKSRPSPEEERAKTELEVAAREELIKRLQHPEKLLKAAAQKQRDKRVARLNAAREYKTIAEAEDAWGWGFINEQQLEEIKEIIRNGDEALAAETSPEEAAEKILGRIIGGLIDELAAFKFELLPPEEQARRLEESAHIREKIKGGKP